MLGRTQLLIIKSPVLTLITIWIAYLLILGMLQLAGFPVGFKVWPLGEDRNWLGFMLDAPGYGMTHLFWATDNRNPLSPWWWILISPLLHYSDWSLYLIRKLIDPLLASSLFLLLDKFSNQQARFFSFSTALIVLFWNFNAYHEQIQWNFLIILSLTLLTLFFYCSYVDSNRKNATAFALGLICYLIAISTYTLQSGALLGIGCISFFRGKENLNSRLFLTARDTSYFLFLFIIYNLIWYTVSAIGDVYYQFNWSIFLKQALLSIKYFFFHSSYITLWNLTINDWSSKTIFIILISAFISIFNLLISISKIQRFKTLYFPGFWALVILMSISAPTLVVEAANTMWYPGARSLMIQQIWQPLLYMTLIFALFSRIPFLTLKTKQTIIVFFISLMGAFVILIGLDYNHRLVLRTYYQKNLAFQLQKLILPATNTYFLIKTSNAEDNDLNAISPNIYNYGCTMLHNKNTTIRLFTNTPMQNLILAPLWKIIFEETGVVNAEPITNVGIMSPPKLIPYDQIRIVFFDGKKILFPRQITQEDLAGLQVEWKRTKSINQYSTNNGTNHGK